MESGDEITVLQYILMEGSILGVFDATECFLSELVNGAYTAIVYVDYTRSSETKDLAAIRRFIQPQDALPKMVSLNLNSS